MRVLRLALITALLIPTSASAQSTAQRMLDTAKQMRASAEQLKDTLPAKDLAKMIKQAEEIEQGVRDGDYPDAPAPKKEPSHSERIAAAHGGRVDWLFAEAACAGYTQENYSTFRYSSAINERDSHCRNAHGHYATYQRVSRAGDTEAAETAVYYYNAAAERAVGFYGRK